MFNINEFNQLTSNIDKDDYIRERLTNPTYKQVSQEVDRMTTQEFVTALKQFPAECRIRRSLEARMVNQRVEAELSKHGIVWF